MLERDKVFMRILVDIGEKDNHVNGEETKSRKFFHRSMFLTGVREVKEPGSESMLKFHLLVVKPVKSVRK